ncbi:MAG: hypothetical protein HY937_06320 [Nitrosomonadales bacterium]|nr:hypothetical protein [Nitrosomonadales bacterium]
MPKKPILSFFGCLLSGWLLLATPLHAMQITLSVADITASSLAARGVRVVLAQDGAADLNIAELRWTEKIWRKVHVHCAEFLLSSARMTCRRGKLDAAPDLSFEFGYNFSSQRLKLQVSAADDERLQVNADFRVQPWRADVQLRNAQGRRLAAMLPPAWPSLVQGVLNGTLRLQGDGAGVSRANADLQLADLAFADASGLHAAEKLAGTLHLEATRAGRQWDWRGALDWQGGELFWQPLYLRGGYALQASGQWDGARLQVTRAVAELAEVGKLELTALWDANKSVLLEGTLRGNNLGLKRLFADFARPFLNESLLAASELTGRGDVDWQYHNGATQALTVALRDAELTDGQKRFMLRGVNAVIPWHADATSQAGISFNEGVLWGAPIGATAWQIAMRGREFSAAEIILPVFDGKLAVQDFHLQNEGGEWQWGFSGALSPVSMQKLSVALNWPEMHGAFSGMIPKVSFRDKTLKVDGALLFHVFDGTVVVNRIELFDPFGRMPRLSGNLDMRELDLDLLTRTFSFGNIQGRIDLSVNGLELVNWQPVSFDAKLASSPGEYRKRISQKAVQNISALGGAGGAAALQRSYMRIFDNFGYSRIGLSCVLRHDVCTMDGVEGSGTGVYTIVKGGGIPAINVLGYNHRVGWQELLTRLRRVLQDNMQAVVK